MNSPFYDTYFYKFSHNTTYEYLERSMQKLDSDVQISIRDISAQPIDEKIHTLNGMFIAERMRKYEFGKQKECYVNIVRYSEDGYLAIISVYADGDFAERAKEVFKIICNTSEISYIGAPISIDSCEKRWTPYMKGFSQLRRYLNKEKYTLDEEDLFPIEIDGIKEFRKQFETSSNRAKAMLSCAFSRVVCAGMKTDSVILEDHISNGRLSCVPLRVCNLTSEKPIIDATEVFGSAMRYNNITQQELYKLSNINMKEYIFYSQAVFYEKIYTDIFKSAAVGNLYKFDAISVADSPLLLIFHMENEIPSVQYCYDSAYFRNIPIEGLHKSFEATLSKLIRSDYTATDYNKYIENKVSNESKRINAIVACLKKCGWFDSYGETELARLAQRCQIKRLFFEQNFIDANTRTDSVYLLVHGKVEVVGRDFDNVLHTLQIIKEMSMFGFESITDKKTSPVDYQVMTDDALAIAFDSDLFIEEATKHGNLFIKAIEAQNSNVHKFQKLWIMS